MPVFVDTVTVSLCSHPPRIDLFRKGIRSLIDQVDHLNVYLNDIDTVPQFLRHPKVHVILGKDADGDLKSGGKFYWAAKTKGYHFIIDDDIIFPSNFVKRMIQKIEEYNRKALICVHGSIFPNSFENYYRSKITICFTDGLRQDVQVHAAGNNSIAFHSDTLAPPLHIFEQKNMDDIYLGRYCNEKHIPIICVERRPFWLKKSGYRSVAKTIYHTHRHSCDLETELVKSYVSWQDLQLDPSLIIPVPLWYKYYNRIHAKLAALFCF